MFPGGRRTGHSRDGRPGRHRVGVQASRCRCRDAVPRAAAAGFAPARTGDSLASESFRSQRPVSVGQHLQRPDDGQRRTRFHQEAIGVEIIKEGRTRIEQSLNIYPTQQDVPFSQMDSSEFTPQNLEIYLSNEIYPESNYRNFSSAFKNGFGIGFLAITPIEYNPVTKEAFYYKQITVIVESKVTNASNEAQRFLKTNDIVKENISKIVDNQDLIDLYSTNRTRDFDTEYLIIAEQSN